MSEIYQPAEDSYLLSEVLKKVVPELLIDNPNFKALDMGSGSGIQAQNLINLGINPSNLTLIDINLNSIKHLKEKFPKSSIIKSSLFEKTKSKFDLIVFNPPYLSENKFDKEKDTTGGKKGDETILKFLRQLRNHLNKNGATFLLLSSLTPMPKIKQVFKKYKIQLISRKKLFYEELYVYELKNASKTKKQAKKVFI